MAITIRQECSSVEGTTAIDVPSESVPGKSYKVHILGKSGICECADYKYRGSNCKHIRMANLQRCSWVEGESLVVQNPRQEISRTCPECGNNTRLVVVEA